MSSPPLVVAVLVANDPGDWLEEALASLVDSDYPNLSLMVVDNGSKVPISARVVDAAPRAFLIRNESNLGFARAVNEAVKSVPSAAYLFICHDDIAVAPDAVSVMVEDALRMNASVVAPEIVAWDYPDRVLSLGFGVDRTGAVRSRVDVGDLDQDQYPIVEEIFAASAAAMLVRHDLFTALGGFDPEMFLFGEDVDLSFRAQLAGARVIASSFAKVRHMGILVSGPVNAYLASKYQPIRRRLRRSERTYYVRSNQLRCVNNNTDGMMRRVSAVQLWVLALMEASYFAVTGRLGTAKSIISALRSASSGRRSAEATHRQEVMNKLRLVDQPELKVRLARGSARLTAFFAHQRNTRAMLRYEVERSRRSSPGAILEKHLLEEESTDPTAMATRFVQRRIARVIQVFVVLYVLIASRHVILGALPAYGTIASFPHGASLLSDFFSGSLSPTSSAGTSVPAGYLIMGILGLPFFGATGLLTHAFLGGLILIGLAGAYRLGAKYRNPLSATLALLTYATAGSLVGVFSLMSLFGLATFAFSPWLVGIVLDLVESAVAGDRLSLRPVLRAGMVGALATALAPGFVVVELILAVAVIGAYSASGKARAAGYSALGRFFLFVLMITLVANASWFAGYLDPGTALASLLGSAPPSHVSLLDLLRFQVGAGASVNPFGEFALLGLVVTPFVARGSRALRAEVAIVAAAVVFILAVASNNGALGHDPVPLVFLSPLLAAFAAYGSANAVDTIYRDLPREAFGVRQLSGAAVVVGVLAAVLGIGAPLLGGRLGIPASGYEDSLGWVTGSHGRAAKVLWIGTPSTIPAGSWWFASGVAYSVTSGRDLSFESAYTPIRAESYTSSYDGLARAALLETTKLGTYLAQDGISYLAYPAAAQSPALQRLTLTLARQVDLGQVLTDPGVTGYQVLRAVPVGSVPSGGSEAAALALGLGVAVVWLALVDTVFFGAFVTSRIVTRVKVSIAVERDMRDQDQAARVPPVPRPHAEVR
ncbi:MAG: glycosyltransferase family 2 protein [Nitrospiraceae bacterium]|nr:glycosyltransferase family 2 protein [Nitrospiraceae bacterium]MDA8262047.1 glycosyltransferase family 2 protein [Actinomycetota bacterium]